MGGILSGLIGGLAKGTVGGLVKEGERKRAEEDRDRNLLTQMHMNRLNDWENLSPQEQEFHIKALEDIHPEAKKAGIFRAGVNLVHAIAPHLNQATLQPMPEVKPVDPLEGIATQAGLGGPETRTPNQTKLMQAQLYQQNLAESERKRKMAAIAGITDLTPEERKRVEAQVETGVVLPQPIQGTWSTSPVHYTDKAGGTHEVIQNNRTRSFMDRVTGQEIPTIPADWTLTPKPVDHGPYASVGPNNELQFTDVNAVRNEFKRTGAGSVGTGVQVRQGVPTFTPLTDTSGNVVGRWSNRAGVVQPITSPPGTEGMRRGPMAPAELDKRTAIKNMTDLLDLVENQAKAHPDYLGLIKGKGYRLKRWAGIEEDPIANDIYGGMADLKEALIRAKEGAVIPDAMYRRLSNMLPSPDQAPEKFWADMKRFKITMANAMGVRGMDAPPTVAAPQSTTGTSVKVRNKKTGQTGSIPQAKLKAALASGQFEEVK